jgi:membrane protein YqaA with SNARE-associated domain
MLKKIYNWFSNVSKQKYALPMLCFFFFIEAIFFIVPVDPLLIIYCCENRKKSLKFAALATISSVAGGIVAYYIGFFLWDAIGQNLVVYFSSINSFNRLVSAYKKYENAAVLIAAFTPVPYKIVTLSAGFCKLPLTTFIVFSFIGRGLRFFLIAILIRIFGDTIKQFIDQYFNLLVMLFTALVFLSLFLLN